MSKLPDFTVIIPARMHSTRLPRKALLDLGGIPMVVRTAMQAAKSRAKNVVIATDHPEIEQAVKSHGFACILTDTNHPTGTDRLAQAVDLLDLPDQHIVVNVQGDEPFIEPHFIEGVAATLSQHPNAAIATLACLIQQASQLFNPNCVKVVCNQQQEALYFSRAPIPWARDALAQSPGTLAQGLPALLHIGLYAYSTSFLRQFPLLTKGVLEQWESLEQLRALEHGYTILVRTESEAPLPGIDTQEDLLAAQSYLQKKTT